MADEFRREGGSRESLKATRARAADQISGMDLDDDEATGAFVSEKLATSLEDLSVARNMLEDAIDSVAAVEAVADVKYGNMREDDEDAEADEDSDTADMAEAAGDAAGAAVEDVVSDYGSDDMDMSRTSEYE